MRNDTPEAQPSRTLAHSLLLLSLIVLNACRESPVDKVVEADYPALKAAEHLTDPRRVARWMEPFRSSDTATLMYLPDGIVSGTDTLTIRPDGPVDIAYRRSYKRSELSFTVGLEPLLDKPGTTRFRLTFKGKGGNRLAEDAVESLSHLSRYLADPAELYGFPVGETTVTDTVFLFASRQVDKSRFSEGTKALFDDLIAAAVRFGVGYNGVRIFHMEDAESGKRTLFAGIGIDRAVESGSEDEFRCKRMPFGHRLLSVDYQGPYHRLPDILQAMERYKSDRGMASMAIPFHKYLQDGYGFTDSQTVKMRVCYPVY